VKLNAKKIRWIISQKKTEERIGIKSSDEFVFRTEDALSAFNPEEISEKAILEFC
jgi:hypothetical protein